MSEMRIKWIKTQELLLLLLIATLCMCFSCACSEWHASIEVQIKCKERKLYSIPPRARKQVYKYNQPTVTFVHHTFHDIEKRIISVIDFIKCRHTLQSLFKQSNILKSETNSDSPKTFIGSFSCGAVDKFVQHFMNTSSLQASGYYTYRQF